MALATKRLRPLSLPTPPLKRLRTTTATATNHAPTARPPLPRLPPDIWHQIATHLPLTSLTALSQTSRQNRAHCHRALLSATHRALLPEFALPKSHLNALLSIVRLLDTAPSLRPKHCMHQLARLLDPETANEPSDVASCFTPEQAAAFLRIDPFVLRMHFPPARVAPPTRTRSRKLRSLYTFAFQPHPPPPPPRAARLQLFCLRTVLRAALHEHRDLVVAHRCVEAAVSADVARFHRAETAENAVQAVVAAAGMQLRELEWVLAASATVVQFRRGVCEEPFDSCVRMVRKLVDVHVGLGPCYKCLLICDGNARLKARRIVEKVLKSGAIGTTEVVRVLEAKLWWAKSKSNVEKMEMMFRELPHIRV